MIVPLCPWHKLMHLDYATWGAEHGHKCGKSSSSSGWTLYNYNTLHLKLLSNKAKWVSSLMNIWGMLTKYLKNNQLITCAEYIQIAIEIDFDAAIG